MTRPKAPLDRVRLLPDGSSAAVTLLWYTKNLGAGPEECWQWGGTLRPDGYGVMLVDKRRPMAHRVAYEHHLGPIPDGLTIDHLCRNKSCVNPFHMEPVTAVENVRRSDAYSAVNARKTHCNHGHEFTPENTYQWHGHRQCRTYQHRNSVAGALKQKAKRHAQGRIGKDRKHQ